ncbi:siroheme biosynthesis protein MET8 [Coprinopsis cinerea okayama7|jgi:precorrin-2 dehydrogenase/sirohydrochlorin ferrochelatase|uniref:precorrin-2 dehydrogenase n=1 Tax=Coprinopsis cinerea (strain Okayama-7 / 130 / ATCC MYA-4618 / FGSC 9003) TaxID=240176 RepID=A8NER0_COPC7|nr:siroheme biosynthesis protein MET8 [Coprinopsis cinerea okayama7\|eukprot:XP_001833101.1 siroheme biosynthesis protein MET8 [Coprinopsis cinerea okayama7\
MAEANKTVGSGSLLIAWQLKDKTVAIIGGGDVASQRVDSLLATDAQIHVVAPASGLHPRSSTLIAKYSDRVTHIDTEFAFSSSFNLADVKTSETLGANVDLFRYDMVLTALDDADLSRRIVEACRARRIPVNAADIPDLCDFYFGGQVRDGPLQIMISTNGNAPRLAALIKNTIKDSLTGYEGEALVRVGKLRNKLKVRAPGVGGDIGKRRMKWMSGICERWPMKELSELDETTMDWLLDEGWENGKVLDPPKKNSGFSFSSSVLDAGTVVKAGAVALGFLFAHRVLVPYLSSKR